MSQVEVGLAHVAAGCNRVTGALHWGEQGLLAYGAHNALLIYHPEEARVLGTLLGHTDRVNCVRWLPPAALPPGQPAALASGGSDGSVRIWQWSPGTPGQPWRLAALLQAHAAPVTSLAVLPLPTGGLLLISTAGDGEAAVWECTPQFPTEAAEAAAAAAAAPPEQDSWRLRQRICLGHRLPGCAALAPLPADPGWLLLALGGVDSAVRLYLCPPGQGSQFEPVCQLGGHQDWIKGLAFAQMDDGKLLLASASQDKNVRVWAVQLQQPGHQPLDKAAAANGHSTEALSGTALLTRFAPKPLIRTAQNEYSATLEALLIGHEDWVHSVAWHPRVPRSSSGSDGNCSTAGAGGSSASAQSGGTSQPACLLSASMDRTMMIWRPDPATGLWMCEESVGDAGANHLGYYTGAWSPDGSGIAAHGFTGALHIWRRPHGDAAGSSAGGVETSDGEENGWLPQHGLGGHYGPVVDACWAADGACLLTVSTDQTARITTRLAGGHWCEVARPQVHGHDFAAVAALPALAVAPAGSGGCCQPGAQLERFLYASGSEEKVVRVFEAPRAFRDTLALARGRPVAPSSGGSGAPGGGGGAAALGALLPALGLSNKAVFEDEDAGPAAFNGGDAGSSLVPTGAAAYTEGPDMAPCAAPSAVAGPPLEEHLAQNTLWPEVHKLYGHGNELYCLAADPLGCYLASACRAQSADVAAVWLWDTSRWTGEALQPAHTLTVTQLAFSPDGRFLASASRDRSVAVFERQAGEGPGFRLAGRIKAHARIVWDLHWSPDSRLLATGARDGKVKVWSLAAAAAAPSGTCDAAALPAAPAATIDCGDSVHSVQFAPDCQHGSGAYHLAAGLEGGGLQLLRLAGTATANQAGQGQAEQLQQLQHELVWQAPLHERHAAAVRRLCWRREGEGEGSAARACLQLASCSHDHSLRVFSVTL
ncbi:hypothetical protein ABPG75_006239 [Micractinium tetrahymenae]